MSTRILPVNPDPDQLRRQAKDAKRRSGVPLSEAQLALAREYGYSSWRRMIAEVRRLTAIRDGDVAALSALLRADPELAAAPVRAGFATRPVPPLEYVAEGRLHGAWAHDRAAELSTVFLRAAGPPSGDALIAAASHGEPGLVRALIAAGADPEARGTAAPGSGTALAHTVHYGMTEAVDLLVAAGAVIHDVVEAAGAGDVGAYLPLPGPAAGPPALRAAAVCERLPVIDVLLDAGVDVNARFVTLTEPAGATALHCAAHEGKARSVRHLLDRGADPLAIAGGRTPLQWCRARHEAIGPARGHAEVERILDPLAFRPPSGG